MKVKRPAFIVMTLIILTSVGCDEAAMVDEIIIDGLTEEGKEAIQLAQLRAAPNGDAASTNPNPNREKILNAISNFPNENTSEEEIKEWNEVVIGASVNINVLDITGCTPNPLVIEVGHGEAIEVKNRGTTDHVLHYGGATLTIPADGSRGIVPSRFGVKGDSDGGDGFAGLRL